nr:MAG TPA: hypothetical protein [Caudoviricetes sp.]
MFNIKESSDSIESTPSYILLCIILSHTHAI